MSLSRGQAYTFTDAGRRAGRVRKNKGHGAVQNETSEMQKKVEERDRNTERRN